MIIESIKEARTIEDAIVAACEELGKDRTDICEEVIQLPKKGFLGKMKMMAKVRAYYEIEDPKPPTPKAQTATRNAPHPKNPTPKAEIKPNPTPVVPVEEKVYVEVASEGAEKKIVAAQAYVKKILDAMGLTEITQTVVREEKSAVIRLEGEGLGVIIGRRGDTLDSLQYLVSLSCGRLENENYRIYIDCGNFREKREETLRELAAKVASQVIKNGRNATLEPMNPYERRIIHSVISDITGVFSKSIGEEPFRKVVVINENNKRDTKKPYQKRV